jgi:hypothetical protein
MDTLVWPPGKSPKRHARQSLCGDPLWLAAHRAYERAIGPSSLEPRVNGDSSVERLRERQEAAGNGLRS